MDGATSSTLYAIGAPGGAPRYVLRVIDNEDWLAEEPDVAAHEAAALEEARKLHVHAPRLIAYSSRDEGFGAPVVLMSFIEGTVDIRPADFSAWLDGLAGELAIIHRHRAPEFPWQFRSWTDFDALSVPTWTSAPDLWKRAIDVVRRLVERPLVESECVFVHRDFHAANVLWRQGRVSGVVDWANACRGPAAVDVAHCRTDLALMHGPRVAEQFLRSYVAAAPGYRHDWRWDLDSILDMCSPEPTYYEPWRTFGLDAIAPQALQQRIDAHLRHVIDAYLRNVIDAHPRDVMART